MGRRSTFNPAVGSELLDLILDGVAIKHAAKRVGVGVRTLYDWLDRGGRPGAPRDLALWVRRYRLFMGWYREDRRRERYLRDRERSRERWQRFAESRESWWLARLGPERFWTRRLNWLSDRGKTRSFSLTLARLQAEGYVVTAR